MWVLGATGRHPTSHGRRWRSLRRLALCNCVAFNSRRALDSRLPAVCAVSESAAAAALETAAHAAVAAADAAKPVATAALTPAAVTAAVAAAALATTGAAAERSAHVAVVRDFFWRCEPATSNWDEILGDMDDQTETYYDNFGNPRSPRWNPASRPTPRRTQGPFCDCRNGDTTCKTGAAPGYWVDFSVGGFSDTSQGTTKCGVWKVDAWEDRENVLPSKWVEFTGACNSGPSATAELPVLNTYWQHPNRNANGIFPDIGEAARSEHRGGAYGRGPPWTQLGRATSTATCAIRRLGGATRMA